MTNNEAIEKLLQNDKELSKEKISLHKVFVNPSYVNYAVKEYLNSILYHNLTKVIKLYQISLGCDIEFPSIEMKNTLLSAITIRHDCVHRNGYTISGEMVRLTKESTIFTLSTVIEYVEYVEGIINK